MESKICKKSLTEFYKHKGSCKGCVIVKTKEWSTNNKERRKVTGKLWYESTKEDRRKY